MSELIQAWIGPDKVLIQDNRLLRIFGNHYQLLCTFITNIINHTKPQNIYIFNLEVARNNGLVNQCGTTLYNGKPQIHSSGNEERPK